jgi:peptide/nickel transport system substrate-binding protein
MDIHTEPVDTTAPHPISAEPKKVHTARGSLTTLGISFWKACSSFEKLIAGALAAIALVSLFLMIRAANHALTIEVPARGGSFTEGMIGSPRFVNPVLATSETDRTLTSLIYSGLMRATSDGTIVNDLAESYTVSDDGKTYTFILREDATFHDGARVTPEDILFTIDKTRDPIIKSPRRAEWEGVIAEAGTDSRTVVFKLEKPYAPFLQNTTLGILPKQHWKDLTSEEFAFSNKNIAPVGSGPYQFVAVTNNDQGIPYHYALTAFDEYIPQPAYIESIGISFFHTEDDARAAYESGDIDTIGGFSAETMQEIAKNIEEKKESTLPRVFGLFLNQSRNTALAELSVRRALEESIDRNALISSVFGNQALPLTGPIPLPEDMADTADMAKAATLLDEAGWTISEGKTVRTNKDGQELSVSIATANTQELKQVAQYISDTWKSLGVKVKVELFEMGDLNQSVLRPRAFDILLFGEITGREPDLYAFWHSSQKSDPGLNLAQYQNKKADAILEKARTTSDAAVRIASYKEFDALLKEDVPAIFLYAPRYTYLLPSRVTMPGLPAVVEPYERFSDITSWYVETERVWHIFAQ